jgi:hypothetical protein
MAALRTGLQLGALLVMGCGPAPYTIGPEDRCSMQVVEEPKPASQEPEDRWIPDGLPRPNPFEEHPTWAGHYDCPQGRTRLAVRVLRTRGNLVRAVFDFRHEPSGAFGKFVVLGTFDEQTGNMAFAPGPWLLHSEGYERVGMVGHVSLDGLRFEGRIVHPGCGAFQLGAAE